MISKAIKHLKWRFAQKRITINEKDIDALNHIIKTYNKMSEDILNENRLFAKLFLNEFLSQAVYNGKGGREAIKGIESILEIPLEQMYWNMKENIPNIKAMELLRRKGYMDLYEEKEGVLKLDSSDERTDHNKKIFADNENELLAAIGTEYSFDEFKKFMDYTVVKLITNYKNS